MKSILSFLILAILFSCTTNKIEKKAQLPYKETWESVGNYPISTDFFLDAKFGIYTHWGPVTVGTDHPDAVGGAQLYGQKMYEKDKGIFKYHKERFGDQNEIGYKEITNMFNPNKLDAADGTNQSLYCEPV